MKNDQFYSSKVVFIAGAGGFIGSHLVERFLAAGARVVGVDNFLTGQRANLESVRANDRFTLIEQDIIDQGGLTRVLDETLTRLGQIDVVLHFASPASPPRYQAHPTQTYLVNSIATHNLLTWLKDHTPEARFLLAGTSEIYGNPAVHPQPETYWGNVNPNGIRSCYDESKRLAETITGVFGRDFGLNTRIIRIFNTYGPRMDLADGRILPQFIKQIKAGEPLTVYGDGSQTRSYCYVSDLVEGIVKFMATDLAEETLNLGNPGEWTVLQTAQLINKLTGRPADEITFQPLPQDDPLRRQPDISKALRLLGWSPTVEFRTGLRRMLEFYGVKVVK